MSTISVSGFTTPTVHLAQSALDAKTAALADSRAIVTVGNDMEAVYAGDSLTAIKGLLKACETGRKAIKEPVLDLGRRIDATAAQYAAELTQESDRLSRLLSAHVENKRREAEEAERKRQAELRRIEEERLAAEREAKRKADDEAAQRAREAQALIDAANSAAEAERIKEKALRDAELAKLEQDRRAIEAEHAAKARAAQVMNAPVKSAPKIEGVSVRKVWRFDVTDIRALYAARPDLVEMTPKTREINSAIATGIEIPGLKTWQESEARVRA